MFRAKGVWFVVLVHAASAAVCPAGTVLCRTTEGSVQVEVSFNGVCSKQLHGSPAAACRSTGDVPGFHPCRRARRHGPCCDTLLSTRDDAMCPKVLPQDADDAADIINGAGGRDVDGGYGVLVTIPPDPPWQQPGLDILRTVRLLT